jgi:hypothetical protein
MLGGHCQLACEYGEYGDSGDRGDNGDRGLSLKPSYTCAIAFRPFECCTTDWPSTPPSLLSYRGADPDSVPSTSAFSRGSHCTSFS